MPGGHSTSPVNWISESGTGKAIAELVACGLQSLGLKLDGKDLLLSVRSTILIHSMFVFSNR